jgi:hypothetical protein
LFVTNLIPRSLLLKGRGEATFWFKKVPLPQEEGFGLRVFSDKTNLFLCTIFM